MSEFLRNWLTVAVIGGVGVLLASVFLGDRKSTRLNSSHT